MTRFRAAVADAVTRWSFRDGHERDPDRLAYRRSALAIGLRVSVVSAALVIGIIALVVAYVFWQLTPGQLHESPGPADVHVYLDTVDLSIAVIGVGGLSIVFAGVAAWLIARRAVRPIAEASRMQRTFVADASHELRTPLTVLHARVQHLQMLTPPGDPRRAVVAELRDDTRVLIDIVNELLEAAAGGAGPSGSADLARTLHAVERDMAVLAADRQVRLEVTAPPHADLAVAVSETQLHRCLTALIDNAIGHARPDGRVDVTAETTGSLVTIRVADDGPGVTGIAPSRVFDRFAHGAPRDPNGVGTRTGYGIGLALVRDIAVRAGGDVTVERTSAHGTVFALRLPLDRPRQRRKVRR